MKERNFSITTQQMAALLMLSSSICQILEAGSVSDDLIEELRYLRPELDTITHAA